MVFYAGNRFLISHLYNLNNGINDRISRAHQDDLSHENRRTLWQTAGQQGMFNEFLSSLFFCFIQCRKAEMYFL